MINNLVFLQVMSLISINNTLLILQRNALASLLKKFCLKHEYTKE